jgi:hypothetical protein
MEINLRVIKRHDPKCIQIIAMSTFVTIYEFQELTQEWVGIRLSSYASF